jgi:hypothetical protein
MRFINRSFCVKQISIGAVFLFCSAVFADYQFEFKGYDIVGESQSGKGIYGSNAGLLYGNFNTTLALNQNFDLLLSNELDHVLKLAYDDPNQRIVTKISPFAEKKLPNSNTFGASLRFKGLGTMSLGLKNMAYSESLPIYPEFLQTHYAPPDPNYTWSGDGVKRQTRNTVNAYWLLPIADFSILADINYFGFNYALDQGGMNMNTLSDTLFGSWTGAYQDLWSRFTTGWAIDPAFNLSAGVVNKTDLNGNSKYNLYRYLVQIKGNKVAIADNNFTWSLSGRWYESEMMKENGFAVGPGALLYLRDVFSIDRGLFLKGSMSLEVGDSLFKERFEVALRKAWESESSIEAGYFTNQGGLFPTQGLYLRTKKYLTPEFSMVTDIKTIWEGPEGFDTDYDNDPSVSIYSKLTNPNGIRFIKAIGNLELAFAVSKHFEFLVGIDYTYYNSIEFTDTDFPSRGGGFVGIRTWGQ